MNDFCSYMTIFRTAALDSLCQVFLHPRAYSLSLPTLLTFR